MKKYAIVLLTLLMIILIPACKPKESKAGKLEKVSITLDWTPNTNHTGLYVAKELGYFEAEGIDIEIMEPGQAITDQVVASGKSQFGISYQENVIRARSEGIPILSIAAVIQHNTSGFASLKKSNISTPKDFEGKRYGSWDSPSEMAILEAVMKKSGADLTKVQVVSGVYDFFSTIGKDADFEWIFAGWDGIEAKRRGMDLNFIPLRDLDPVFDYYTPVIITNQALKDANPELIKRFMKAVSRGYEFCVKDPQKAAEILVKHVPELDSELVKLSQDFLAKEYQAEASKWGFQKEEIWKSFSSWMYDNRLIPLAVDVSSSYTNEFLP